ncbi:competence protein ComG, partial [Bacillus toyonensis]
VDGCGVPPHAHQLNILKYPPNEKIALLKVNIELEYRLSRINI